MRFKPIGIIHSPFKSIQECPIQPSRSKAIGEVEIFKEYQEGLEDIEGFSHLILIYRFHKSKGYSLKVKPFLDDKIRGLFATRYPRRPNQIGLSIVKLLKRKENILSVEGIDVVGKTPLLDIKPYVPDFIPAGKVKIGWLKGKIK
ncbi:MAG: tRNA (N6-threonylcarbamoyladenosine(37)-N6)-methyltransferase TrmO [Thermodesulfovibrionales bacterium]|nr:tRNA (N6-threonylcarbamoyladenosine(37)-N6)-methyltransferase TrmO [Thermodesulfovibrionales bacterium]